MTTERNPFLIVRHAPRSVGELLIVQRRGLGFAARRRQRFLFGGGRGGAMHLAVFGRRRAVTRKTYRDEGDTDEQKERQFPRLKKPELNQRRADAHGESGQTRQQQQAERVEFRAS